MFESRGCRLQCGKLVLNIPISVAEILVPQIAREHYQTLWDRIGLAAPTANKRGGKSVAKIIKAGMRTRSVTGYIAGEVSERALDLHKDSRDGRKGRRKTGWCPESVFDELLDSAGAPPLPRNAKAECGTGRIW